MRADFVNLFGEAKLCEGGCGGSLSLRAGRQELLSWHEIKDHTWDLYYLRLEEDDLRANPILVFLRR
jgi:hypothetical protein